MRHRRLACVAVIGVWFLGWSTAACARGRVIYVPSDEAFTISRAFLSAKAGDTVVVKDGIYHEHVFIEAGVVLQAANVLGATIDGKGRGTVVSMGKNSVIDGFVIRNGTIGVFSKNAGTTIKNCRIVGNWQSGLMCVRHLPQIEDNVIAFNRGSGIQGWDVRATGGKIIHNTIAYNSNNGIAVGGKSSVVIEKNIVAFNERFALKLYPEVEKVTISENNFFQNLWSPTPLPQGNYSFDPKFANARVSMDFTPTGKSTCEECPADDFPGARLRPLSSSFRGDRY